jgi:hypothetical protein
MRNLFKRWQNLTGRSLRTVATVIAADFGECTVQYPGGSTARVKGYGTIGARYFILDGRLDGEAPALATLTIEV